MSTAHPSLCYELVVCKVKINPSLFNLFVFFLVFFASTATANAVNVDQQLFQCKSVSQNQETLTNFVFERYDNGNLAVTHYPSKGDLSGLSGSFTHFPQEQLSRLSFLPAQLEALKIEKKDIFETTHYVANEFPQLAYGDLVLIALYTRGPDNKAQYAGSYGTFRGDPVICSK